jgi:hypothetical protein
MPQQEETGVFILGEAQVFFCSFIKLQKQRFVAVGEVGESIPLFPKAP